MCMMQPPVISVVRSISFDEKAEEPDSPRTCSSLACTGEDSGSGGS